MCTLIIALCYLCLYVVLFALSTVYLVTQHINQRRGKHVDIAVVTKYNVTSATDISIHRPTFISEEIYVINLVFHSFYVSSLRCIYSMYFPQETGTSFLYVPRVDVLYK